MKVAIVNSQAIGLFGGAEFLADHLKIKLVEHGFDAQIIRFPFSWYPAENIVDSMMAVRLACLDNTDRVIGLRFPAYLIEHPDKRLWLLHQFRQAYDLHGTEFGMFGDNERDRGIRDAVRRMDTHCLKSLEGRIHTNSHIASERLMKYNGIASEVLFPPLFDAHLYSSGPLGDYLFYPSRVNHSKRQYLAVEAMRLTKSGVKLVLAGKGDTAEDEERIHRRIEEYGLKDRILYLNRFISQEEKAEYYRNSLGVVYIPYDEDSYGYVTLEAMQSEKAILTCSDSGGTDVVVLEGRTGHVAAPTPDSLAEAMDEMFHHRGRTEEMGRNGPALIRELGIDWDRVIERLTQ
jgi:glycosyltransferase involved in cell wall biosynthesis